MLFAELSANPKYGSTEVSKRNSLDSKDDVQEEEQERQKWGSPVEFLLSCIAMSVSFCLHNHANNFGGKVLQLNLIPIEWMSF